MPGNITNIAEETHTMSEDKRIIFITDLIDQRLRKEQEITYYEKELRKIEEKLFFLRKEKQLTQFIIDIIEQEKVVDIRERMYERISEAQRTDTEGDR